MKDLSSFIALSLLHGVGSVLARQLVAQLGTAEAVLSASRAALLSVAGVGVDTADKILRTRETAQRLAQAELKFIKQQAIRPLLYTDADYPKRLQHCEDAPLLLYYKGKADLNTARVVAIVGTRSPTERGQAFCRQLVSDLSPYNVLIVSGLALGIDITAHQQCLHTGTPTVGVVAHGLDRVYPAVHRKTAMRMAGEGGGLLTEFISGTAPLQQNFPMRNRIIAGMSDAVVVVETAQTGGSMITAYFANEYQKDVFALPGRVDDPFSLGCNHLIKTHRAALLESAADIAYIMRWERKRGQDKAVAPSLFVELSTEERQIMETVRPHTQGVHLDYIIQTCSISTSRIAVLLLEMELKGLLRALPGKHFVWL